jgi:hypothetical protein
LRAQPDKPATIAELQLLLDRFAMEYNTAAGLECPSTSFRHAEGFARLAYPRARPLGTVRAFLEADAPWMT